jgi:hypothetical protein
MACLDVVAGDSLDTAAAQRNFDARMLEQSLLRAMHTPDLADGAHAQSGRWACSRSRPTRVMSASIAAPATSALPIRFDRPLIILGAAIG